MSKQYHTRLVDLPPAVRGFVYKDEDGNPCIILNARLTRAQNRKTYDHEVEHIEHGDLDNPDYLEYNEVI